jgi:hypothetical protein
MRVQHVLDDVAGGICSSLGAGGAERHVTEPHAINRCHDGRGSHSSPFQLNLSCFCY